jgi:DNA polymerase-3 subunit alpha
VVRPPDVNRSTAGFSIGDVEQGEILYGLRHIKTVGERIAQTIVECREAGGPFTTLLDLCLRVGSRELNRRVLEALIRSGACDGIGERSTLLATVDRALDRAAQIRRERESGQTALFGDSAEALAEISVSTAVLDSVDGTSGDDDSLDERLRWEREFLGMYLSDHPLRRVAPRLQERIDTSISELGPHLDGLIVQVGGAVRDLRAFIPRRSSTGQRMAFLQIEDLTGACEVVVFARTFEECVGVLRPDAVVVVRGKVEAARPGGATPGDDADRADIDANSQPPKILAEAVFALDDARLTYWKRDSTVHIRLAPAQQRHLDALRQTISTHRGESPVLLRIETEGAVDEIALADEFTVDPGPALERAVTGLLGEGAYRVSVRRERAPERELAGRRR